MSGAKKWKARSKEEVDYCRKMYALWEKKYQIARDKGKDQEAENIKKHLDYWFNQL